MCLLRASAASPGTSHGNCREYFSPGRQLKKQHCDRSLGIRVRSLKDVFSRGWVSFSPSPLEGIAQPALIYYGSYIKPCFSSAWSCFTATFHAARAVSLLQGCHQKEEVCGEEGPLATGRMVGHHCLLHLPHQPSSSTRFAGLPSVPKLPPCLGTWFTLQVTSWEVGLVSPALQDSSTIPVPRLMAEPPQVQPTPPTPSVVPMVLGSHQAMLRIVLWLLGLAGKKGKAGGGCARSLVPRRDGLPQVSRPLMDQLLV